MEVAGVGVPRKLLRSETNASLLKDVPRDQQVVVQFSDICAWVPVLVAPGAAPSQQKKCGCLPVVASDAVDVPKERQVLFNINGTVQPGEILALMGPSGSGKSSLLQVLGGRSKARISGSILFNGSPLAKAMKRKMGFVTQDDLLFAELTTYETLYYAALLRLPRDWTKDQKKERVEMVLQGLGLSKCRDTIIGNHMMRGVSGGERKRVSIGHELLINPSVLFLDEPTSGLDSTTALKLIHTLRSLASGGRTIIASIHQPSSRLYSEMNQLLLLSDGHTLFYGEAHASATWFGYHGLPVPFGVSTPDHMLDLACADLPGLTAPEALAVRDRLVDAFRQRTVGLGGGGVQPHELAQLPSKGTAGATESGIAVVHVHGDAESSGSEPESCATSAPKLPVKEGVAVADSDTTRHDEQGLSNAPHSRSLREQQAAVKVDLPQVTGDSAAGAPEGKWGASWYQQVQILTSRCVRTRRFQSLSIQRFAEVLIVAVLAGLFWFQVGSKDLLSASNISDINGLLFFQVLFMAFSCLFQALFNFPADFQMLVKERQSGMYRLSAYYTARTLSDFPMDCFVPSLFCWIIYWMAGLRMQPGAFFANWWGMLLTMLCAQSIGLFVGATIDNPKTAIASASIFMLGIMLVGGFYVQDIPAWIGWLKYGSFIYYGYALLLKIEYGGRGYNCERYYNANPDAPPGLTYCPINDSGLMLVDTNAPVTLEVCVLLGMLLFLRIAVYVSLKQRTTFKSKHKNKTA